MKTSFTPGPWRISGSQLGNKLLIEHGDENTRSPVIGSVYTDDGKLPQDANARLIAAAPDLLEAIKAAQVRLFMLDGSSPEYKAAGAAIIKATGAV